MSIRAIILIAVGLFLIYLMFTVGAPFLLALIVAIFLEPVNGFMMKRFKMNRLLSAVITCTLFTVIFIGLIVLLGIKIVAELIAFMNKLPHYFENAIEFLISYLSI